MINFFRREENVDMILSFIMTPREVPLSDTWKEAYPDYKNIDISDHYNEDMARQFSTSYLGELALKQMQFYYLRSFKATEALTLYSNFRFILNSNPNFIDTFFKKLYQDVFKSRRTSICNFDHVARMIMFMMEKESYIV